MKAILYLLDTTLGYLIAVPLYGVFYLAMFLLSLLGFPLIIAGAFEYEVSINDVDGMEATAIALLFLVSIRFFWRGNRAGNSVWVMAKKYIFISAMIVLFSFTALSFILMDGSITVESNDIESIRYQDFAYLAYSLIFIVVLYGSAPLGTKASPNVTSKVEPTMSIESVDNALYESPDEKNGVIS